MNDKALLEQLEFDILPKMPSVENGWRLIFDTCGQQVLAQAATNLIHLSLRQQDKIEKLESEIAELKKQIQK